MERSFFNGQTMREEVWLSREVRHCELNGRTWDEILWCVTDIDAGGKVETHRIYDEAAKDYEQRVAKRVGP